MKYEPNILQLVVAMILIAALMKHVSTKNVKIHAHTSSVALMLIAKQGFMYPHVFASKALRVTPMTAASSLSAKETLIATQHLLVKMKNV